ncbi:OmpA family protein [Sphingomonas sanguinis]|uniref:OmpA family protein n=1 Tax=Sphingomonas sanguinis TaxID=33051 RepID=A0ABU5LQQ2_9SPHN|nr:OmpA family protein [Sphingomonas sanguinis]MDZ7282268.1 OmpA family protein [Sphingomonas sanguinis]QXT34959.1 OmpA family protein [Sphingomonas sanguinis]
MRLPLGAWKLTAGLACMLTGCGGGDEVARQAGANGASIEMPVPAASPAKAPTKPDALPGETAADQGASLTTIGFPQGGGGLNDAAKAALDRLGADPAAKSGSLILRGHSDSEGDDEANRIMSRKRAETVRDYLARKGLERSRMRVIALGETRPIAPNAKPDGSDDSAGRARNRRVEIELNRAR